ncbi:MAG: DUF58 domain-containing protein [Gammaproteobacteria bacterium]|jgi:uncharacterized protein (DUF58 family)
MQAGLAVTVAELIALAAQAQRVHYPPKGYAARIGLHQSRVRGRGMDFSEARNYQAGDEVRHMEWRMTARTGRPHVKVYHEERERPVLLVVDFCTSMFFGTRVAFKSVIAARLAAILAWTAAEQGDRVGGLLYSEEEHRAFTPRTRRAGVLPFLAGLSHYSQANQPLSDQGTQAFDQALTRIQRLLKPGSIVVIISDFYHWQDHHERLLRRLSGHHDLLAYHICDPLELGPPLPQLYGMSDGNQDLLVDTSLDSVRFGYQFYCEQRITTLTQQMQRIPMQYTQVTSDMNLALLVKHTFPQRLRSR